MKFILQLYKTVIRSPDTDDIRIRCTLYNYMTMLKCITELETIDDNDTEREGEREEEERQGDRNTEIERPKSNAAISSYLPQHLIC